MVRSLALPLQKLWFGLWLAVRVDVGEDNAVRRVAVDQHEGQADGASRHQILLQ